MLYQETTTLGIRIRETERECIERELISVESMFGTIDVKIGRVSSRVVNVMPEYDQVKRIALENKVAFSEVRNAAIAAMESDRAAAAGK